MVSYLNTMCLVGEYLDINVSVLWPWISLVCLPGLVLTAFSWTYISLRPSRQWIICNKAIPSQKGTHIWCAEFKFPDLSSRGLQSGMHEHPSFFVWSLRVGYIYCIKLIIDSMIQEWCMHEGQYGSKETTFWNEMSCLKFIYLFFASPVFWMDPPLSLNIKLEM